MSKVCTKCDQASEFYQEKDSWCKICKRQYQKRYRRTNLEEKQAKHRVHSKKYYSKNRKWYKDYWAEDNLVNRSKRNQRLKKASESCKI